MTVLRLAPLHSRDEAWAKVLEFCRTCERDKTPVRTLAKGIVNYIVYVDDEIIKRVSEGSPNDQNTAHIRRSEFDKVWAQLVRHRCAKADPHVFLLALICAAMPEIVEYVGNRTIVARNRAAFSASGVDERQLAGDRPFSSPKYIYRDLGEGFEHWVIKNYIYDCPAVALQGLAGGPWNESRRELEVQFDIPTRDRVDVIVYDSAEVPVLIEVKPNVEPGDIAYYAQAAKYRAIWQVLFGASRCVIAAPKIPRVLREQMWRLHDIDSVEVVVPPEYRERQRPNFDAQSEAWRSQAR